LKKIQKIKRNNIKLYKKIREKAGIKEGDVAKIKLQGKKIVIESQDELQYRTFTKKQIEQWVKDDELPPELAKKTEDYWKDLP